MAGVMADDTEIAGARDGVNKVYTLAAPYFAGSLRVFHNGNLQDRTWVAELNPSAGTFEVEFAPRAGDKLGAFYLDTAAPLPETFVSEMTAQIEALELTGALTHTELTGGLVVQTLQAEITTAEIQADVTTAELLASIEAC